MGGWLRSVWLIRSGFQAERLFLVRRSDTSEDKSVFLIEKGSIGLSSAMSALAEIHSLCVCVWDAADKITSTIISEWYLFYNIRFTLAKSLKIVWWRIAAL